MMMDEMMQENPNEQQPAARPLPKKARRRLKWFQYQWILGNVPYFLFLSVLAIVYIYNGHYADKTLRSISKMGRELKDMQYEFKIGWRYIRSRAGSQGERNAFVSFISMASIIGIALGVAALAVNQDECLVRRQASHGNWSRVGGGGSGRGLAGEVTAARYPG